MSDRGRPLILRSPERAKDQLAKYFKQAKKNKEPITLASLAAFLGTSRKTLINYRNEDRPEYQEMLDQAKAECEAYASRQLFRVNGSVSGIIFNLKNNYGWVDEQIFKNTGGPRIINITLCSIKEMKEYEKTNGRLPGH